VITSFEVVQHLDNVGYIWEIIAVGLCCCKTAALEQSPLRTMTTGYLPRTIPPGAKEAIVLLRHLVTFLGAVYKCTYLLNNTKHCIDALDSIQFFVRQLKSST